MRMKWAGYVKDKVKAAVVLALIMVVILLGNIAGRHSFDKLGNSISSIYQDRLLPSSYLFELSRHLYEKKMQASPAQIAAHDKAIAGIIKEYEATYLTPKEKQEWLLFKNQLQQYNISAAGNDVQVKEQHFTAMMNRLEALNKIQLGEGDGLRKASMSTINGTVLMSYMETGLLIVLGICTLILLSVSDKILFKQPANPSLN